MKVTGYAPGSMYKRFYGSNMSRMNRETAVNASSAISSYGAKVFDSSASLSQGISEIAAKKYAARVSAEARAKMQGASTISSTLRSLGISS